MVLVTTTTTSTTATAASLSTLSMSLSLPTAESSSTPTSIKEMIKSPEAAMQPFTPGQCLFCPHPSPSFTDSVMHMQKSHGLFIPQQQHLIVDLETLFRYMHLVIFGYRECLHCGTERATVQGVQQHMTGKGHCKFDISEEDSEFAEFYDFSEPEEEDEDVDTEDEGVGQSDEASPKRTAAGSSQRPLMADEDSIRLPSGKIISKHSSAQAIPSSSSRRRRARTPTSQLEYRRAEPDGEEGSGRDSSSDVRDERSLSKREKRERAAVTHQLAKLSTNDRNGLMHLPMSQQRSILATQYRQAEKLQKEERRRQGKIDRKGNKNLYAYWNTETPVYQCG